MTFGLHYYTEPLNGDELRFLKQKELSERSQYYKVFKVLMFFSFLFPFLGAWYRAAEGAENAFSPVRFFVACAVFLFISIFGVYMSYRVFLRNVQRDIKYKTKTVEKSQVTKKTYIQSTDSYYLYINSSVKLSIEVSREDFNFINEGDEVNIEYATFSKHYFGYF